MMGFLIDEKEFEVLPAITRAMTLYEVDTSKKSRIVNKEPSNPQNFDLEILFREGVTELSEKYNYTVDINVKGNENINSYSVFINDNYVGDDIVKIQINTNDFLKLVVEKIDDNKVSTLSTSCTLL